MAQFKVKDYLEEETTWISIPNAARSQKAKNIEGHRQIVKIKTNQKKARQKEGKKKRKQGRHLRH